MSAERASPTATFGGGCFWCLEAVFEQLRGVSKVVSGYAGGHLENPTYRQVCDGNTGHAEVIQVTFDPSIISYRSLLEVFFGMHDPTTLNRQGPDQGTQYRSAIYYSDDAQKEDAEKLIGELNEQDLWGQPIVTEVAPLETFYPAEDYHQGYFRSNPTAGYCQVMISPKLTKLRSKFSELAEPLG